MVLRKEFSQSVNKIKDDNIPLLTICCITYNHEKYIKQTIESFLMQKTNFKIEIIIHDDASTDQTAEIIRSYKRKYPSLIKHILQEENQFSKGNKNIFLGPISQAEGKYIALCEGDDYWSDPYKLQKQVDYLENNPECTLCTHATQIVLPDGISERIIGLFDKSTKYSPEDVIINETEVGHTSSMVFPKEVIKQLPDWYSRVPTEDTPLKMISASKGYGYFFRDVMSVYRKGVEGSWTVRVHNNIKNKIKHWKNEIMMLNNFNDYTEGKFKKAISARKEYINENIIFNIELEKNSRVWSNKLADYIKENNLKQIAIFGIKETAVELKNKLREKYKEGIIFLDNFNYGKVIDQDEILHPTILKENPLGIDLVVITIVGEHYIDIKKQIHSYNKNIQIFTLKDLIEYDIQ